MKKIFLTPILVLFCHCVMGFDDYSDLLNADNIFFESTIWTKEKRIKVLDRNVSALAENDEITAGVYMSYRADKRRGDYSPSIRNNSGSALRINYLHKNICFALTGSYRLYEYIEDVFNDPDERYNEEFINAKVQWGTKINELFNFGAELNLNYGFFELYPDQEHTNACIALSTGYSITKEVSVDLNIENVLSAGKRVYFIEDGEGFFFLSSSTPMIFNFGINWTPAHWFKANAGVRNIFESEIVSKDLNENLTGIRNVSQKRSYNLNLTFIAGESLVLGAGILLIEAPGNLIIHDIQYHREIIESFYAVVNIYDFILKVNGSLKIRNTWSDSDYLAGISISRTL